MSFIGQINRKKVCSTTSAVAFVLPWLAVSASLAGPPEHNRGIQRVWFQPGSEPGLCDVYVEWFTETDSTASSKDLSADVNVLVDAELRGTAPQQATIANASGPCLGTAPPCDGSACGTWNFGIVTLDGFCLESILGGFCTCACVVVTVVEDVSLTKGELVTVELQPAGGALAEPNTSDDTHSVTFDVHVPATSTWGLAALTTLVLIGGTLALRRRAVAA